MLLSMYLLKWPRMASFQKVAELHMLVKDRAQWTIKGNGYEDIMKLAEWHCVPDFCNLRIYE